MRRFHSRGRCGWRVALAWSPRAPDRGTSRVSGGQRSAKFPTFQIGRAGTLSQAEGPKDITWDRCYSHARASRQTHAAPQDACMREFNVSSVVAMRLGGIWWEQRSGTVKAGILRLLYLDLDLWSCSLSLRLRIARFGAYWSRNDDHRGSGAASASGPHHDDGLQEIHHRQDVQSAQEEGDAAGAGVFGLQRSVRGVGHVEHPDQDRWVRFWLSVRCPRHRAITITMGR